MYFEFENEIAEPQYTNSKSNSNGNFPPAMSVGSGSMDRSSSSSPTSPRKNLFGSSLSSSLSSNSSISNPSSSTSAKNSPFLSPLLLPSSTPILPQRQRRYSIHSSPTPVTFDSLQDNSNVTFCDLALITKKKLLQLKEEFPDPDAKLLTQDFSKTPNKDLRRGVLLASIQRSLSVSSDDLSQSPSSCKVSDLNETNDKSDNDTEDLPMEIASNYYKTLYSNNNNGRTSLSNPISDEMMTDCFSSPYDLKKSPISRIRARRSPSASYTPQEIQNMNSATTCTSTTSMAGNRNGANHCRNYIKKLNNNALNLSNGPSTGGNSNSYYSCNTALTLTMSSDTSLKKRLHSSSPSKYPSPYHTTSNSVYKEYNPIYANASNVNSPLSPEWDMNFKRLKVMHGNADTASNANDANYCENDQSSRTGHAQHLNLNFPPNTASAPPEHELNELTQDFDRLKTPFT